MTCHQSNAIRDLGQAGQEDLKCGMCARTAFHDCNISALPLRSPNPETLSLSISCVCMICCSSVRYTWTPTSSIGPFVVEVADISGLGRTAWPYP